jgi:hypothetical protein
MTTQTEAERLADLLDEDWEYHSDLDTQAAAELRRLVSFNQQLMDEVARLKSILHQECLLRKFNKENT